MAEKINLFQQAVTTREFERVVNTEFSTFIDSTPEEDFTVEDFFVEYERLFYEIPAEGENESHEYLIRKSSELVDIETETTDITPLLDEIASLREQLLEANSQIVKLQSQTASNTAIPI